MHSSNKNATISCSFRSGNEAAIPKCHVKRTRGNVKINLRYTKNNYPHVNENRRIQTKAWKSPNSSICGDVKTNLRYTLHYYLRVKGNQRIQT